MTVAPVPPNKHMLRSVVDKVHAPDHRTGLEMPSCAAQVRRTVADVGR